MIECHSTEFVMNPQAMNGPQYARPALQMLYGKRWAEAEGASAALGGFAAMVAFLAVNGITEAFAHAIMVGVALFFYSYVLINILVCFTECRHPRSWLRRISCCW